MTTRPVRRRGEPLVALAAILLCWGAARVAIWQAGHPVAAAASRLASRPAQSAGLLPPHARPAAGAVRMPRARSGPRQQESAASPLPPPILAASRPGAAQPRFTPIPLPVPPAQPFPEVHAAPALGSPALLQAAPFAVPASREPPAQRRWSLDAWALVRSGGGFVAAPSLATYGASQVGAVLRYRLLIANPYRPVAYLRATAALNGSGEREAALGLSFRPIAKIPVTLGGEGRIGHLSARTVLRPAVLAVTEIAPVAVPGGALAEVYLQGGYVGGTGATAFVDGQVRVDKRLARLGLAELRVGAGAWGGAQEGTSRLDVGPSATLALPRGAAALRVGLDWRLRVAGSARPASGPALTISAGF